MSWWLGFGYPRAQAEVHLASLNVVVRPRLEHEPARAGWFWHSVWSSAGSRAEAREAVREALRLLPSLLIWSYGGERPPWELFPQVPVGGPLEAWAGSRPERVQAPEPRSWWLAWLAPAPLASPPGRPTWLEAFGWRRDEGLEFQARVRAVDLVAAQSAVVGAWGRPVRWLGGQSREPLGWSGGTANGWRLQWGLPRPPASACPPEVSQLELRGWGPFRWARGLENVFRFEALVAAASLADAWEVLEAWNPNVVRGEGRPWLLPQACPLPAPRATPATSGLVKWRLRCGLWVCAEPPAVGPELAIHARGRGLFREAGGQRHAGVWCFDLDVPAKTEAEAWGVARATLGPGMLQGLGMPLTRSRARRRKGK